MKLSTQWLDFVNDLYSQFLYSFYTPFFKYKSSPVYVFLVFSKVFVAFVANGCLFIKAAPCNVSGLEHLEATSTTLHLKISLN